MLPAKGRFCPEVFTLQTGKHLSLMQLREPWTEYLFYSYYVLLGRAACVLHNVSRLFNRLNSDLLQKVPPLKWICLKMHTSVDRACLFCQASINATCTPERISGFRCFNGLSILNKQGMDSKRNDLKTVRHIRHE